jgi:chromosome segregation ATPase
MSAQPEKPSPLEELASTLAFAVAKMDEYHRQAREAGAERERLEGVLGRASEELRTATAEAVRLRKEASSLEESVIEKELRIVELEDQVAELEAGRGPGQVQVMSDATSAMLSSHGWPGGDKGRAAGQR